MCHPIQGGFVICCSQAQVPSWAVHWGLAAVPLKTFTLSPALLGCCLLACTDPQCPFFRSLSVWAKFPCPMEGKNQSRKGLQGREWLTQQYWLHHHVMPLLVSFLSDSLRLAQHRRYLIRLPIYSPTSKLKFLAQVYSLPQSCHMWENIILCLTHFCNRKDHTLVHNNLCLILRWFYAKLREPPALQQLEYCIFFTRFFPTCFYSQGYSSADWIEKVF